MERPRAALVALMGVLISRIFGAEVEMKVRPGDNVTLYSDCVWKQGFFTVWFRNCSHEHQPPLMISREDLMRETVPRYPFVWNPANQTHDLLVKNVTESDLGLYYCALQERKLNKDEKGLIFNEEIYHYGSRTTRLSFLEPCVHLAQATPPPPVSDCSVCWKLLVSVCPVCVLLSSLISSTCVYCICRTRNKEAEVGSDHRNKSQLQKSSRKSEKVEEDEVCYASLDIKSRGQKRQKKTRVENLDFSTYSEVKTNKM